jgi:hypothetical protein
MLPQFQVPSQLVGFFLNKLEIADFKQFLEHLPWRLPELDGPPRVNQSLPKNAPPDITRAVLSSRDQRIVLEMAPAKLQLRVMPGEIIESEGDPNRKGLKTVGFAEACDKSFAQAMRIFNVFSEHYGLKCNRVGVMTEFIAPIGSSANQRLQRYFLGGKDFFGERLFETQINALAKMSLGTPDRQVNRWVRVRTLRSSDPNPADMALGIEVDINTVPEDTYDINASDLEAFFGGVRTHIDTRIPFFNDEELFRA